MVRNLPITTFQENYKNPKGFTLVEIFIAIAIIRILTTIAIPNYIGYRYKSKITKVIVEIKSNAIRNENFQ